MFRGRSIRTTSSNAAISPFVGIDPFKMDNLKRRKAQNDFAVLDDKSDEIKPDEEEEEQWSDVSI